MRLHYHWNELEALGSTELFSSEVLTSWLEIPFQVFVINANPIRIINCCAKAIESKA